MTRTYCDMCGRYAHDQIIVRPRELPVIVKQSGVLPPERTAMQSFDVCEDCLKLIARFCDNMARENETGRRFTITRV